MGKYQNNFMSKQIPKVSATNNVSFVFFFGIVLLSNLMMGCSINHTGLVDVKHFENKTIHMVNLITFGCFLSTNEADAGLTFGFTERQYFYPKDKQIMEVDLTGMLILAKEDRLIEQEKHQISVDYSDKAIAWLSNTKGLTFNTNRHRVGFSLGTTKSQTIKLHKDFEGIFIFKHILGGETNVFYNQDKPLD